MSDPRYTAPVGDLVPFEQPKAMREALQELQRRFPGLGVTLFVFDYGDAGGGIMYGSTARRGDMLRAIDEWRARQTTERN